MAVTLLNDCVIVEDTIKDSQLYTHLLAFDAPGRVTEIRRLLDLGFAVSQRVTSFSEQDYLNGRSIQIIDRVDSNFQKLSDSFEAALDAKLNPDRRGSFLSNANQIIAAQTKLVQENLLEIIKLIQDSLLRETSKLESKLDPQNKSGYLSALLSKIDQFDLNLQMQFRETDKTSFVGKLHDIVDSHFGDSGAAVKLLDDRLQLDSGPLGQVYVSLKGDIATLRDLLFKVVGQQEIREITTVKGYAFEEEVFGKLEDIARCSSDLVEDVSKISESISQSKKGDFVYTALDTGSRFVLDSKAYGKLNSLKAMLDFLNDAIRERSAQIGILVVPEVDSLQKQIGEWNFYDGNKIITPLSFLEVSLKFCKYSLRAKAEGSINNPVIVRECLESVERKFKEITSIKTKLTKMANGVSSVVTELQAALEDLREDVLKKLETVQAQLSTTTPHGVDSRKIAWTLPAPTS